MTPIEQWMVKQGITSVRDVGAPDKAESPYKVMVEKEVPWLKKGEKEKVPVNDPDSQGWTFTLSKPAKEPKPDPNKLMPEKKLPMPKRTQVKLQFFTPPGSNKAPGIEDLVEELQREFDIVKKKQEAGDGDASMPQPFLGTMLILHTWLTDELFLELMNIR